jgi:hypothetical protein
MATAYKSEFSAGNGKLKEVAGLQFIDDTTDRLSASVLMNFGAGFELAGTSLTSVALATGAHTSGNSYLPTKGYVDEAIAAIPVPVDGDPTTVTFSVAAVEGFAAGNLVAIGAGATGLVLADKTSEGDSNLIGAVKTTSGGTGAGTVTVQVDGEIAVASLAAYANGDLVFVGAAGGVSNYASIGGGNHAVQAGIISNKGANKIILQQRIFGLVA